MARPLFNQLPLGSTPHSSPSSFYLLRFMLRAVLAHLPQTTQREMCRREIRGVEWTPRMLSRRHKSWKHHFGVRLRAVDPFRAALAQAVPQLLDDARTRRYAPTGNSPLL